MTESTEEKMPEGMEIFKVKGFGWRVSATILLFFAWIIFFIVWLFFYAEDYTFFQNFAVFIVSVLFVIGVLAAMWAAFGIKMAEKYAPEHAQYHRPSISSIVSGAVGVGWLIFLVVWLFYYASDYNAYQNLAVILASLLALAGITGIVWFVDRQWTKLKH